MPSPFLSICIPSYNRPRQLSELLASIDCQPQDVEIVICEDGAPKRLEARACANQARASSSYQIFYHENEVNLGFDGNLRRLIELASGEYVMFMGDDDFFVPRALDRFIGFLRQNRDKKYILRSYITVHSNGHTEHFKYLPNTTRLPAGEEIVAWLFKRSVTICGFTISRAEALRHATAELDGTLLYQVYLMAQVCLANESIYCDIPVAHAVQSFRDDKPMFGASRAERSRYTPGSVSVDNSINFSAAYFEVTGYLDKLHETCLTDLVRIDLSKYSYPFLSIQRKRGIRSFLQYARRLEDELGFGCTAYFHFYKWALVLFGEAVCDRVIMLIKHTFGYTPKLR